ncbi:MAG: hypothetical protein HN778_11640 [Prolixibacteraceae bacterium]|jgi:hypothetical protein|nr:hypothetical protein [Prolixibacteraceae bacterium]MBT6007510.1 hypothetical protein [Prolixibacteraceae bacterium]MBT6763964.1 hypothetical protein [Prolixibacteraceae bacterium]MBT7000001.1 hypothetical protein [Prolixibacteraceae bacterium]MBT7395477.1 hypothetical protein [Prolixibacteraceae bacterium]
MSKIGKIITILLWVLLIISAVLIVSLIVNISENDADAVMGSWINSNLIWAYILVAVGAGVAVIAGLLHMATDIKAAKGGLVALIFLAAVAVVSYLLASDAIPQFIGVEKFVNEGTLTAQVSKLVDTGLIATYILLAFAIISTVFSSVVFRLFK